MKPEPIEQDAAATVISEGTDADDGTSLTTLKEKRRATMRASFGLLKGKAVFPPDGLEYQRQIRAEWE